MNKMVALNYDNYQALLEKQQEIQKPVLGKIVDLDQELKQIANDSSLPADFKLKKYQQIYQRQQEYQREFKKPLEFTLKHDPVPTLPMQTETKAEVSIPGDNLANQFLNYDSMLEFLPKNVRNKAKMFLDHITRNSSRIKFNNMGELIYDGGPVEKSNYRDLLYDFMIKGKRNPPPGAVEFARLLNQTHVPRIAVPNTERLDIIKRPATPFGMAKRHLSLNTSSASSSNNTPTTPPGTRSKKLKNGKHNKFNVSDWD